MRPPNATRSAAAVTANGSRKFDQAGNQVDRDDRTVVPIAQASTAIVHRCLPFPSDDEIRWLLGQGLGDAALISPWPLKVSKVNFEGGAFHFDDRGERAIVFRAEDRGECTDLIAWSPRSGKLATWRGVAFCLGDLDQVFNPATYFGGEGLRIWRSPIDWLRAGRDGITIVRPDLTYAMLHQIPRVVFADAAYARQVQCWLLPPKPCAEFLVEVPAEREAA